MKQVIHNSAFVSIDKPFCSCSLLQDRQILGENLWDIAPIELESGIRILEFYFNLIHLFSSCKVREDACK